MKDTHSQLWLFNLVFLASMGYTDAYSSSAAQNSARTCIIAHPRLKLWTRRGQSH